MKVALVKPPHSGSLVRGVGFYGERLYSALQKLKEIEVKFVDFSFSPNKYKNFDLVHFVYFDLFYLTFPPIRQKKTIVTLHDIIPLKFPEAYPLGIRGKTVWPIQNILLKTVNAVITDSQTSKNDISRIAGISPEKINVTYLAADNVFRKIVDPLKLEFVTSKYRLPKKFVLYVGGVNWNKNLLALVEACQKNNLNLVIVGKEALEEKVDFSNVENTPFKKFLEKTHGDEKIKRLGYVPTEDLVGIYSLATVYCQPSIYEGFGLPVLEAMGCGCPVVCGKNSSLSEIAGNAATYADVQSPDDLAEKIKNIKPTGLEISQAKKFSWEKTAKATYDVYQKVLAG